MAESLACAMSGGLDNVTRATPATERATGIEPAFSAWEADVLPLNYTREGAHCRGRGPPFVPVSARSGVDRYKWERPGAAGARVRAARPSRCRARPKVWWSVPAAATKAA